MGQELKNEFLDRHAANFANKKQKLTIAKGDLVKFTDDEDGELIGVIEKYSSNSQITVVADVETITDGIVTNHRLKRTIIRKEQILSVE